MRIVHISTHDLAGGAARAALRLHQALLAAGQESAMVVRWKLTALDSVHEVKVPEPMPAWWGDLAQTHYLDQNRSQLTNTFFSLGWPGHDLSRHPVVQGADILHLHWVSCFQSPATLGALRRLGKPIVWTLHDQRAFTGGCHYSAGCTKYETGCRRCPQLAGDPAGLAAGNLADQVEFCAVTCVLSPSRWLAECARRSRPFRSARIEVIPSGIDAQVFRPLPRAEARQKLGLPADGLQLLFGAGDLTEQRKGFRQFVEAIELAARQADFQRAAQAGKLLLVAFGKPSSELERLRLPTRVMGQVSDDETLRALYSAANAFVLPSLEDNLPNTALESLSCGTPVVGFATGGVPDMVSEGQTGFLVPTGEVERLAGLLSTLPARIEALDRMGPACRRAIEEQFTLAKQAERCVRLYQDLLAGGVPKFEIRNPKSARPDGKANEAGPFLGPGIKIPHSERLAGPGGQRGLALAWRAVLRKNKSLFDVIDPGLDDPVKARFLRERLYRRLDRRLRHAARGDLSLDQLLAQMESDLASLQAPIETPGDKRRYAWLRFKLRFW